ncbi:peptidase inhibitor family I36 protein [Streptomyces sp. NPDC056361]|uniref:peptidase inhibitor family I36 protein n=1 Tax=Streptomyces sp. NPDC056361 TaxID=3345795 RepID=UPI0035DA72F4
MVAAIGAVLGLSGLNASTAQANSQFGCPYPYVCVYEGYHWDGKIVAMFKDVTSYYQYTTPRTFYSVVNTRNDDTVWVQHSGGSPFCIQPNMQGGGGDTITGIRISSSASC